MKKMLFAIVWMLGLSVGIMAEEASSKIHSLSAQSVQLEEPCKKGDDNACLMCGGGALWGDENLTASNLERAQRCFQYACDRNNSLMCETRYVLTDRDHRAEAAANGCIHGSRHLCLVQIWNVLDKRSLKKSDEQNRAFLREAKQMWRGVCGKIYKEAVGKIPGDLYKDCVALEGYFDFASIDTGKMLDTVRGGIEDRPLPERVGF